MRLSNISLQKLISWTIKTLSLSFIILISKLKQPNFILITTFHVIDFLFHLKF